MTQHSETTLQETASQATTSPEKTRPVNVAILGAGDIAHAMATTLNGMLADERYAGLVRPYAVATRNSQERAQEFANKYGIPVAYGSYEQLYEDPQVDLVYIATPHALHADQAIACMKHGKAVLVEKSFTANAQQARRVLEVSRDTGQACVEAIWTRFMPSRKKLVELIDSGVIGEVTDVSANLSYPLEHKARIMDPQMAGGALLDVGVYTINFIDMMTEDYHLDRLNSVASFTSTGVDQQSTTAMWRSKPGKPTVMATATSSTLSVGTRRGMVMGTKGYMIVTNINNPEKVDIYNNQHQLTDSITLNEGQITGYEYQVVEAAKARMNGEIEAPSMPHADTLRVMEIMDSIREQWGEVYPFER